MLFALKAAQCWFDTGIVVILNTLPTSLYGFVYQLLRLDQVSLAQLAPDAANRMRRSQIRGAIEEMRVFLAGNTLFAPTLSLQAWNTGINALVVGWTALMLAFSWVLFFRWNNSYHTEGSESDMNVFVAETQVNAGLWCLGMVLFYPFVEGESKTIITIVMTGSLALGTVAFAQAPRAAFWFLAIQTVTLVLVPLSYGIYWRSFPDVLIAGLALLAGLAILNTVIERARAQMVAFVNHESLLQKSEVIDLLLKDYEEQGVEWAWRTDAAGRVLTCPQPVAELLLDGRSTKSDFCLLAALEAHCNSDKPNDLQKVSYAFEHHKEFHDVTLPLYSKVKREVRWIMMRGRPQFEGKAFVGFRGIFADATTSVEAKRQVAFLAENDQLTGTFNRNYIQKLLEGLDPEKDNYMAYLIDLDGFKQVNDSYGHVVGDQLLEIVAQRLRKTIDDAGIVARLGGDEFLILTTEADRYEYLSDDCLSDQMLAQIAEPFRVGRYDIALSTSIGTASFPHDTDNGPTLLNLADLALYAAKNGGRNKRVSFVPSMQDGLQKRLVIMDRLRHAVLQHDIIPFYQPQYCAQTHRLVGFEALARWEDVELGMVGPGIFIPIAEETGLIHEIGEQLLLRACNDAMDWPALNGEPAPILSVNVSPVQVMRGNVINMIQAALTETGLPPERLEIEVTEGVLIDDMIGTRDVLQEISNLGVRIALDDFGTGYSSLSYLRALPLQRLKIDQSFITDIEEPEAQSVVQTIIDLSRRLNLEVVAEGVETQTSVDLLHAMNCDVFQGYFFSRPIPASDVRTLLGLDKTNAA